MNTGTWGPNGIGPDDYIIGCLEGAWASDERSLHDAAVAVLAAALAKGGLDPGTAIEQATTRLENGARFSWDGTELGVHLLPTVSIVVATFGAPEWAERGAALADDLRRRLPDAHEIIAHHSGAGVAEARNAAAAAATGDWLCFVDADDNLADDYIYAMTVEASRQPGPALIQPATRFNAHGDTEVPAVDPQGLIRPHADLTVGNHLVIGTLVRRDQFHTVGGFDPTLDVLEDWDLWIRCWQAGAQLASCPAATYIVNVTADGHNLGLGPDRRAQVAATIRARYRRV